MKMNKKEIELIRALDKIDSDEYQKLRAVCIDAIKSMTLYVLGFKIDVFADASKTNIISNNSYIICERHSLNEKCLNCEVVFSAYAVELADYFSCEEDDTKVVNIFTNEKEDKDEAISAQAEQIFDENENEIFESIRDLNVRADDQEEREREDAELESSA